MVLPSGDGFGELERPGSRFRHQARSHQLLHGLFVGYGGLQSRVVDGLDQFGHHLAVRCDLYAFALLHQRDGAGRVGFEFADGDLHGSTFLEVVTFRECAMFLIASYA